jgi:hypothetical protein
VNSPTHNNGNGNGNGHPSSDLDEQHRQLTTLAGWRLFVDQAPTPPQLLSEHDWRRLGELDRLTYDEDRLNHHARLLVVATPTIRKVITSDGGCPTSTATPTAAAAG